MWLTKKRIQDPQALSCIHFEPLAVFLFRVLFDVRARLSLDSSIADDDDDDDDAAADGDDVEVSSSRFDLELRRSFCCPVERVFEIFLVQVALVLLRYRLTVMLVILKHKNSFSKLKLLIWKFLFTSQLYNFFIQKFSIYCLSNMQSMIMNRYRFSILRQDIVSRYNN